MSKPSEVFLELWQWRALDQSPEKFAECAAAWRQIVSLEEIYAEVRAKDMANRLAMEQVRLVPAPMPVMEVPASREITYDCASAPMTEEAEEAEAKARKAKESPTARRRELAGRLDTLWRHGVSMSAIVNAIPGVTLNDVTDAMHEKELLPAKFDDLVAACVRLEAEHPEAVEAEEAEAKAREAANRSAGGKAGVATRRRNLTERLEELRRRGVKMHEIAAAEKGLTITDVMDALQAKPMSLMKIQALEKACRKLEEADAGGGEDS